MAIVRPVETESTSHRRFSTHSPVDERIIGEFDVTTAAEVELAVDRARQAQIDWAARSFPERRQVMQAALAILMDRQEEFVDRIVAETGRSRMETTMMEIFAACDSLNFFGERAQSILCERSIDMHLFRLFKRARLVYQPLGVVGVITPWNGPFILALNPTVQALMAGNAVIVKPSEITPDCGRLVEELFTAAGAPNGLVQVITGDGETGAALIESGVNKISFTGSVATGKRVAEACGRNLIACTLELGGKDPAIICADADLDRAVGGTVFGCMMNGGQFCSGVERVYVVAEIAEAFIERVANKVATLKLGHEGDYDIGPFISAAQIDIVESHVNDAVNKGAKVLVGGKRSDLGPYFFEPTLIVDVTHEMSVMTEETFGPVLPIMIVSDEEEAIRMANDTQYGLAATVWTKDKDKGVKIARRLDAGSVILNDSSVTYGALELPFGGMKSSGLGRVNGEDGLRGYCRSQPILINRFNQAEEFVWYPYTEAKRQRLKKAIHWLWGTPFRWLMK